MNYRIHENGWTVIFDNFDLREATQDDINQIAKLLATNTLVVFKKQNLTVEDELRIVNMFDDPEPWCSKEDFDWAFTVPGTNGLLARVTGEKDKDGNSTGLADHIDEMIWHSNRPWQKERRSLIWLYGVKGTAGSITTWNNNILTYETLPIEKRELLKKLKICPLGGLDHEKMDELETDENVFVSDAFFDVVQTNIAGKVGLFFPFLQINSFVGMTREESLPILTEIGEYTVQPQFCYDHHWEDGDLTIAEQWLGIHKRHRFEKIHQRLLHRAAFNFPNQNYLE